MEWSTHCQLQALNALSAKMALHSGGCSKLDLQMKLQHNFTGAQNATTRGAIMHNSNV
jgi:hypothetical protein